MIVTHSVFSGEHCRYAFSMLGWYDCYVAEQNNCGSVHVSFLVTTEKLQQPILGFNALKVIMDAQKNAYALVKMFSMLFKSRSCEDIYSFDTKTIWWQTNISEKEKQECDSTSWKDCPSTLHRKYRFSEGDKGSIISVRRGWCTRRTAVCWNTSYAKTKRK